MMNFKKPWAGLAIVMLLLHLPLLNFSQQFYKRYRSSVANENILPGYFNDGRGNPVMRQTPDGGFIWVSAMGDAPSFDVLLTRTDINGNLQWEKRFSTPNSDLPNDVWPTPDGGYIICGGRRSSSTENLLNEGLLIKTDAQGNQQWARTYGSSGNEHFLGMRVLADGFLLAGKTQSFGNAGCTAAGTCYSPMLVKTNFSGQIVNHRNFGFSDDAAFADVVPTNDNGFLAVGNFNGNVLVVKTNSQLQPIWTKGYTETFPMKSSGARSVERTNRGYAIGGWVSTQQPTADENPFDAYLLQIDQVGGVITADGYGAAFGYWDEAFDLVALNDGFVLAAQRVVQDSPQNRLGGYAVRTDLNGNLMWDKSYHNVSGHSWLYNVERTQDGDFIFGGNYQYSSDRRFLAIKTNTLGSAGCQENEISSQQISVNPVATNYSPNLFTGISSSLVAYASPLVDVVMQNICATTCPGSEISVNWSGNLTVCDGTPTTITVNGTGGTAPYTYVWSDGQTGATATFNTGGTFTVWAQDANGCIGANAIPITAYDVPNVSVVSSAGNAVCEDDVLTLSASFQFPNPTIGVWYDNSNPGVQLAYGNNYTPPTDVPGNYTYCIDVYVSATCSTTACFTFSVAPAPAVVSLNATYCESAPADFIFANGSFSGNGAFTSTPPGAVYSQASGNNTFWYFDPSVGPGVYTVEYCQNVSGCCSSQLVTVIDEPDDIQYGEMCADDPCLDLTTLVSGQATFSGPGVSGNNFCPSAVSAGVQAIQYCLPTQGGCGDCATIFIEVQWPNAWPKLAAEPGINARNERGEALTQDDEGNFYMTGFMTGSIEFDENHQFSALNSNGNGTDLWVVKYNECGVEWAMTASNDLNWTAPSGSIPTDILYDKGRIYVSANVMVSGNSRGVLLCLNAIDGSLNSNFGYKIVGLGYNNETWANRIDLKRESADGNPARLYVTGAVKGQIGFAQINQQTNGLYNSILNSQDIYVAAYTTSGGQIFMTTQGGKGDDVGRGIAAYPNGDVAIIGDLYDQGAVPTCNWPMPLVHTLGAQTREVFVGRYFANGCEDWLNLDGGKFDDTGIDIKLDANQNLIGMGKFQSTNPFPARFGVNANIGLYSNIGRDDIFLVRYNSQTGNAMNGTTVSGSSNIAYFFFPHSLHIPENQSAAYISGSVQGTFGFDFISNVEQFYATNSLNDSDPFVMRFQGIQFSKDWVTLGRTPNGFNDRDQGTDVIVDDLGNAYLTGGYSRRIEFATQPVLTAVQAEDYFAVRLNMNGAAYKEAPEQIDPVVGKTALAPALSVYPNPNRGAFKVDVQGDGPATLRLVDLHGRVAVERRVDAGAQTFQFELAALSAGMYLLVYQSEGTKLFKRVIVE